MGRHMSKRKSKFRPMFLYFISNGAAVKIGISKDVKQRLAELQTSCPMDLTIVKVFHVANYPYLAKASESKTHKHFKQFKIRGEWFTADAMNGLDSYQPKTYLEDKYDFRTQSQKDKEHRTMRFDFGRFKGEIIDECPMWYLEWAHRETQVTVKVGKGGRRGQLINIHNRKKLHKYLKVICELNKEYNGTNCT